MGRVAARTDCVAGRVAHARCRSARTLPYRSAVAFAPRSQYKKLYRDSILVARTGRGVAALLRRVTGRYCAVLQPMARCVATLGLSHVTIQMIVSRHTLTARSNACALSLAPSVGRSCRRAAGRIVAPCCAPQLPCVTIQFAVS